MNLKHILLSVKIFFKNTFAVFAKRLVWILAAVGVVALGFDVYVYYQNVYLALETRPSPEIKILKIKEARLKELSKEMQARKEKKPENFEIFRDLFRGE